jgi:V8-like Glu-specific endopeptidase
MSSIQTIARGSIMKASLLCKSVTAGAFFSLSAVFAQGALAGSGVVVLKNDNPRASEAAFTAADYASAKPMQMIASAASARELAASPVVGEKASSDASSPLVKVTSDAAARLYSAALSPLTTGDSPIPVDRGTSGADYTLSGMIPDSQANALTYPHVTHGKLYFSVPGGTASCSAAVIRHRIIATAGHCVSDGNGHFYSNWRFVPATYNGSAPLQVWNWRAAVVTNTWHNGGGGVPNAADYAMIELQDRPFGGVSRKIGQVTGWLGWQTASCRDNHTHKNGYPTNVFGGQRLSLASSNTHRNVAPFNCEYGSPQTFGVSGGPWVQNFGTNSGILTQRNPGRNRVVAVASYTYLPASIGLLGASELDNRWVDIYNTICALRAGNCS